MKMTTLGCARATIIMACAEGLSNNEVARRENTTPATVARWRRAFCGDGCRGLRDAPRAGRPRVGVELSDDEREALLRYQRRATVSQSLAARARIVMLCAQGHTDTEVAKIVAMGADTVSRWRRRFAERRLQGLLDDERVGAPRKITDDVVEALVVATLESTPKGATHWSTRSMADKLGISNSSVGRIWRALGLKPHRSETFQLSTDPLFVEKVRDVVGLYMNPPDNAVVLCVDEKSQIQALKPHPADAAAASWASRAGHARVPTQRDDDALRGPGQGHWQRHRQVLCPPPRGRVPKVPQ